MSEPRSPEGRAEVLLGDSREPSSGQNWESLTEGRVKVNRRPPKLPTVIYGNRRCHNGGLYSFCPKANYGAFIQQIDNLIHLRDERNICEEKIESAISRIRRGYGSEQQTVSEYGYPASPSKKGLYNQVVNAYFEIRRRLKKDRLIEEKPEFDQLIAALEIVGAIIMKPDILGCTQNGWFEHDELQALYTRMFASEWTKKHIEKITWPSDGIGLFFHTVEEYKTRFHYIGDE